MVNIKENPQAMIEFKDVLKRDELDDQVDWTG